MRNRGARLLSVCAGVLLGASLSAPALAQGTPAQPPRPGERILRCLRIVGLTDAQKVEVKKVFEAAAPVFAAIHETTVADRAALKAALAATPQDPCAVGKAVVALEKDRADLGAALGKTKSAVEALLTADQKAKLAGCLEAPRPPAAAGEADEDGASAEL